MTKEKGSVCQTDRISERSSGIELLKVIAIVLIVLFHMTQTYTSMSDLSVGQDYHDDLSTAFVSARHIFLLFVMCLGSVGNTIFFVCSAWFLLDDDRVNGKKWFFMLFEVWVVSIFFLGAVFVARSGDLSTEMIKKSIFPSIYGNNWYITCYLLFYPLHRYLNRLIYGLSKRELLGCTLALGVLYLGITFIRQGLLFTSNLVIWVAIYFLVAYIKLYMWGVFSNRRTDILLIIFAVIGQAGIILINNFLESKFNYPNSRTLRWSMTNSNPLYIVAAIAALFLVRTSAFHSRTINYISSLSMLIYIVHENILIKAYYRPRAISYVYSLLGGDHMLLGLFLLTAAMLALSLAVSAVYGLFLRKHVRALSERIFEVCKKSVARIEDAILKLR